MISETRREQHFAKTEKGVLTGIKEAHNSTEDFYCLSCGCRMQKKCGKIRDGILPTITGIKRNYKRTALMKATCIVMQNIG